MGERGERGERGEAVSNNPSSRSSLINPIALGGFEESGLGPSCLCLLCVTPRVFADGVDPFSALPLNKVDVGRGGGGGSFLVCWVGLVLLFSLDLRALLLVTIVKPVSVSPSSK